MIIIDNGCEFLNFESLEKSCKCDGKRFEIYFVHPYSSGERGMNKNIKKTISRFIPKGTDISKYSNQKIKELGNLYCNF